MNPSAKPFVSKKYILENLLFDDLENQFVKNNKWLFEDLDNEEQDKETKAEQKLDKN